MKPIHANRFAAVTVDIDIKIMISSPCIKISGVTNACDSVLQLKSNSDVRWCQAAITLGKITLVKGPW